MKRALITVCALALATGGAHAMTFKEALEQGWEIKGTLGYAVLLQKGKEAVVCELPAPPNPPPKGCQDLTK